MTPTVMFNKGDRVLHPRRPEWGPGTVDEATPITHEGRPAQRLIVTFANHGRVTINTGVATLQPTSRADTMSSPSTSASSQPSPFTPAPATGSTPGNGWLGALGEKSSGAAADLWRLPDSMTDPFQSLSKRLEATLDSYRFSTDARALIDWAVAQTGLSDPLSKYTRHELEQGFARFARDRENHLVELVRTMKRQNKTQTLHEVAHKLTLAPARNALAKALRN